MLARARTFVCYLQRIWDDMQPLRAELLKNPNYFTDQWEKVLLPHFRNLLAPGTIDLAKYKAADGDALTITVQARSTSGDANGGVSRDFQIGIRKYHARVMTASSAFYLRRNGTILDDQGKPISQTFAPAPGVTFGPVFYSRGMKKGPETEKNGKSVWIAQDTTWSRFYSALAPGIGINVSLMNFSSNDSIHRSRTPPGTWSADSGQPPARQSRWERASPRRCSPMRFSSPTGGI